MTVAELIKELERYPGDATATMAVAVDSSGWKTHNEIHHTWMFDFDDTKRVVYIEGEYQ